jgi:multisite-specific tRNA:(cytosine-C5)-methyltransferase
MKAADPEKFCKWRIVSDGIDFFRPFMGSKRIIQCHINVLKQLMRHDQQYPLITDLEDETFREKVRQLDIGSCIAEIFGDNQDDASNHVPLDLMVGLWISKLSINLMVDKKERKVLSLRLWGEDITLNPDSETRASRLAKDQHQASDSNPSTKEQEKINPDQQHEEESKVSKSDHHEAQPIKNEATLPVDEVKPSVKVDQEPVVSTSVHPEAQLIKHKAALPVEETISEGEVKVEMKPENV